jgi:hypothetical protein
LSLPALMSREAADDVAIAPGDAAVGLVTSTAVVLERR